MERQLCQCKQNIIVTEEEVNLLQQSPSEKQSPEMHLLVGDIGVNTDLVILPSFSHLQVTNFQIYGSYGSYWNQALYIPLTDDTQTTMKQLDVDVSPPASITNLIIGRVE